ncbi:helix-turn-helix domain-containing protein [Sphingobacterium zeae]|uniref:Transposase n=2 Tax=Sphingobacterium TaxID=28453 RepID=A0ABU0U350_9SPHI|nr:helix-turn-helix domain-containing protein [Sphingobacterium zeae]MDQ1149392.1 transposase [Sphingobacterium zeae]
MEEGTNYVKRTQRDYTLTLKLNVVKEIESGKLTLSQAQKQYGIQGDSTIRNWLKKYGNFDWENQIPSNMAKSPEQRILELEAKVRLLEKQKAKLEHQNHIADSKAIIFDMMIDIAEKEYKIDVRKNLKPAQSIVSGKKNKKA